MEGRIKDPLSVSYLQSLCQLLHLLSMKNKQMKMLLSFALKTRAPEVVTIWMLKIGVINQMMTSDESTWFLTTFINIH